MPVLVALGLVLASTNPVRAQEPQPVQPPPATEAAAPKAQTVEELQKEIQIVRDELTALKAAPKPAEMLARITELERKLDVLAQELEKLRMGASEGEEELKGRYGLGPAASKVYGARQGVSIAGYGEVTYQNFAEERQDGVGSGRRDEIDYLRAIVYVGFKFTDKLLFNSEIEFEHASTGAGGEVSVELAYLDYLWTGNLGLRGGLVLIPVGLINELHEPPIFHGVLRPDVERFILPTTWRENGVGVFGEAGPLNYRAYVVAGLDATGYSAAGIRGGRQQGARSFAEDFALTGRLDYVGLDGLLIGGSFFTGNSGQGQALESGQEIGGRTTTLDLHAQFERGGLQVRALYAAVDIDDAEDINEFLDLTGPDSVGSSQFGAYVQVAYDVASLLELGRWSLTPFGRYEVFNTQDEVPPGFSANPANDVEILTLGVGAKPIPNIVLKVDWQSRSNEADTGVDQFNVGLGYLF